jgi:hypothetical protein
LAGAGGHALHTVSAPSAVVVPGLQAAETYVPTGHLVVHAATVVSVWQPPAEQLLHARDVYVWPDTGAVHWHSSVFCE